MIQEAYIQGISARTVDDLVRAMGLDGVSQSRVSRLCAKIDERVQGFLTRPIEGGWPYLWLDATCVKICEAGRIVSVAVLIAAGVNSDGRLEVLGRAIGASEAEIFWLDFLKGTSGRRQVCLAFRRLMPSRRRWPCCYVMTFCCPRWWNQREAGPEWTIG